MVSPAGSFAGGLERGMRLGMAADESKWRKSEHERVLKEREREDRINTIVGKSFQTAAPAAPAAGAQGLQSQQPPDLVSQLNTTLSNLMTAAGDPANADIAPHLFDKAGVILNSSKRFGDVMLNQARQKAMPHIKTLYNPSASDEQKTQALGSLMNEVFPDGGAYQPRVVGKEIQLFDGAGKPMVDAKGKPRTMSFDDVDAMITQGLSTPEDYIGAVQESIKSRREQALAQTKLDEQRAYDENRDESKYRRTRQDQLSDRAYERATRLADRAYTESQALTKEDRADKRAMQKSRRDFIAKSMAAFDKDAAAGMVDSKERAAYLRQVRRTADENFGDGTAAPEVVEPAAGDTIEVDMGEGLAPAPSKPAAVTATPTNANLPQVPKPAVAPSAAPTPQDNYEDFSPRGNIPIGERVSRNLGDAMEMASGLNNWAESRQANQPAVYAKREAQNGKRILAEGARSAADQEILANLSRANDKALAAAGFTPQEIAMLKQMREGL